jgi:capsular polysaccharide biosynthesis protein
VGRISKAVNLLYCPKYNILLTKNRRIVADTISTERNPNQFALSHLYSSNFARIAGTCSTIRSLKNGYYHTLIDNIPRLYLLDRAQQQSDEPIKLLFSSEPSKIEKFLIDKLLSDCISIEIVDDNKLYSTNQFIFPHFLTRRFSGYLPPVYIDWFVDKVAPPRPRTRTNRIFISRRATEKGMQRCVLNEDELFNMLADYGFKRYVLEDMSIEEQIALFYDAEFAIAPHGAGLANLIYSHGIGILELFPMPFIIPHYYYLSKALNHRYWYWCSHEKGRNSNFKVDLDEVRLLLENLLQVDPNYLSHREISFGMEIPRAQSA